MNLGELYSILLRDKPSSCIIKNEDKIFSLIPELKACKGFNQNNEWHVYDVYNHILHVVDNVSPDLTLRLAALFHDIGKPISYTEDENHVGHFFGHWEESRKIFEKFAFKYNIDEYRSKIISNLIFYHDLNVFKLSDERIFSLFTKDDIILLYKLKRADLLAQNKKYHYILNDYDDQEKKILLKYDK